MIQRVEQWRDGVLLGVEEIDIPDPAPRPLDATGALATLLVVEGVLPITDAANAVGATPQQLIDEAQGWAAAAEGGI